MPSLANDRIEARILACARKNPEKVAIYDGKSTLTYQELAYKSAMVAVNLKKKGITPASSVAVLLPRDADMVILLLGILRCGAYYVPIDESYPKKRVMQILTDVKATGFLSTKLLALPFTEFPAIFLDATKLQASCQVEPFELLETDSEMLAYTLFTSGSTGRPKGVEVPHRAVDHFIKGMLERPGISQEDILLCNSSIAFDMSIYEIWLPLTVGASIVILPRETARQGKVLADALVRYGVTTMIATPASWRIILEGGFKGSLGFKAVCGGETFPKDLARKLLDRCGSVFNIYGPTETTVICVVHQLKKGEDKVYLGRAIFGTPLYILDKKGQPVPDGERGELYISGPGLSRGYCNRPELTKKFFLPDPFSQANGLMYASGDIVYRHSSGLLVYCGRKDHQVKIRGFRIELLEIEEALKKIPQITESLVISDCAGGESFLVAYYITKKDQSITYSELRSLLLHEVPDYMVPKHFIQIKSIPLNANGKVDRSRLPPVSKKRPHLSRPFIPPKTQLEQEICQVFEHLLGIEGIGLQDNFFELGGYSLIAVKCVDQLEDKGIKVPTAFFFENPTVEGVLINAEEKSSHPKTQTIPLAAKREKTPAPDKDIAIIGIALKAPGANDLESFWQLLLDGRQAIGAFSRDELEVTNGDQLRENYIAKRGILKDYDGFDHAFFGFSPSEARVLDPQQRLFLQAAWHALEDAALVPHERIKIGVYAGCSRNTYFLSHVIGSLEEKSLGDLQTMILSERDFLATRTSFKLNLRGPSVNVHTACSSSLVAIHQARKAILSGECDIAIAGGVSLHCPVKSGHLYQEGSILSKDGKTRCFDKEASGTVFSDGVGVVVLSSLKAAKAARRRIYSVLQGSAINNDGSEKASFFAPSIKGQAKVIEKAILDSRLQRSDIAYIEAHGTATPIGDPIEIEALKLAFRQENSRLVGLGSVKANIGHLNAAAGVMGLIKASLCLYHGKVPAQIHFKEENPALNLESAGFMVPINGMVLKPSDSIGVSSFGVGGTNAHAILSSHPKPRPSKWQQVDWLALSAKSTKSLSGLMARSESFLSHTKENILDIAYTSKLGRQELPRRAAYLLRPGEKPEPIKPAHEKGKLIFIFPGQGAQYLGMSSELYLHCSEYRRGFLECSEYFKEYLGQDLSLFVQPKSCQKEPLALSVMQTIYGQPLLFSCGYALSCELAAWGVLPDGVIGHSVGEYAAACVAGYISLKDACKMVAVRAESMSSAPNGSMLEIRSCEKSLQGLSEGQWQVSAYNSKGSIVASGEEKVIRQLKKELDKRSIASSLLASKHPFHSEAMKESAQVFRSRWEAIQSKPSQIPMYSTLTGEKMGEKDFEQADYWSSQIIRPTQFYKAHSAALKDGARTFIEMGPGRSLVSHVTKSIREHGLTAKVFPSIGKAHESSLYLMKKLQANLWVLGFKVGHAYNYKNGERCFVSLPQYPFENSSHWIEKKKNQNSHCVAEINKPMKDKKPLIHDIRNILAEISGIEPEEISEESDFFDLGMDSLFLTQIAQELANKYSVKISFRDLAEKQANLRLLADFIAKNGTIALKSPPETEPLTSKNEEVSAASKAPWHQTGKLDLSKLIQSQLELMNKQLALLSGSDQQKDRGGPDGFIPKNKEDQSGKVEKEDLAQPPLGATGKDIKPFGAIAKICRKKEAGLTPAQKDFLHSFQKEYNQKTSLSKKHTSQFRSSHADPRVVSGFKPELKELIYPIVTKKAKKSQLWDLDGNAYVDISCGFGSNFFGHGHPKILEAITSQLERGMEIGPQTPLAGQLSEKICQLTGMERVAFCNTGSEAVLGAIRIARTQTARSEVVIFQDSYHGINDEALVRPGRKGATLTAAPGILKENVQHVVVLPYSEECLFYLEESGHKIAAVLVEPIQSRNPENRPAALLRKIKELSLKTGFYLIFDEIITGFRLGPKGARGYYGVEADIVTYGKVIGGGASLGVIAGRDGSIDPLDGGLWQYGDDSSPTVGVTYFAGTFVRHPLSMAAANAACDILLEGASSLAQTAGQLARAYCEAMNDAFSLLEVDFRYEWISSCMKLKFEGSFAFSELLAAMLRYRGIFMMDGFPQFISIAHTKEDLKKVYSAYISSILELKSAGFLPSKPSHHVLLDLKENFELEKACLANDSQREIWLACQISDDANRAYNESISLFFDGDVNLDSLVSAINELVCREQALRSFFSLDGKKQMIRRPWVRICLEKEEVSLKELLEEEQNHVFNLHAARLIRFRLVKDEGKWVLCCTAHHIICDGYSFGLLIKELASLYNYYKGESAYPMPMPLKSHIEEYARVTKSWQQEPFWQETEDFWLKKLADKDYSCDFAIDKERRPVRELSSRCFKYHLSSAINQDIIAYAKQQKTSAFVVRLSLFGTFLASLKGKEVILGVPIAGQTLKGFERLMNNCVRLLPMTCDYEDNRSFEEQLSSHKKAFLDLMEHNCVNYMDLVRLLKVKRDPKRPPLISIMFNEDQGFDGFKNSFHNLNLRVESNPRLYENFDLFINVSPSPHGLLMECQYNISLYSKARIEEIFRKFEAFAAMALENPKTPLAKMDRTLLGLSGPKPQKKAYNHILEHFKTRCAEDGELLAVYNESTQFSYAKMAYRASLIASRLHREGVREGQCVALIHSRRPDILPTILAIWQLGAHYVPIDPSTPPQRAKYYIENAGIERAICDAPFEQLGIDMIYLREGDIEKEAPYAGETRLGELAYVIYTSGSTGKPKGVAIEHKSLSLLFESMIAKMHLRPRERYLSVTTISFDVSIGELFLGIYTGSSLFIAPNSLISNPKELGRFMGQHKFNLMQCTPSLYKLLLASDWQGCASLRAISIGEVLSRDLAGSLLPLVKELWNFYGPTEATVYASAALLKDAKDITIGRPLDFAKIYILDHDRSLLQEGKGEIAIAGPCLGRGYVNQEKLTGEKFPEIMIDGRPTRIYLTGDVGQWREDGSLEIFGRKDQQLKVRGHRIEPEEVAAACRTYKGVTDAICMGDKDTLVALISGKEAGSSVLLKEHLAKSLPSYMIPSRFVWLKAIPTLLNGKTDLTRARALLSQGGQNSFFMPLDNRQRQLLHLEEAAKDGLLGFAPAMWRLGGEVDVAALQKAFQLFTKRHAILGCTLSYQGEKVGLSPRGTEGKTLEHVPLQEKISDVRAQEIICDLMLRPKSGAKGPLLLGFLVTCPSHHSYLAIAAHGFIWDGSCFSLFLKELSEIYSALLENRAIDQAIIPLKSAANSSATPFQLPKIKDDWSPKAERCRFRLSSDQLSRIESICKSDKVQIPAILIASYLLFKAKKEPQKEARLQLPISTRSGQDRDRIAYLLEDHPITVSSGQFTFKEQVRQIQSQLFKLITMAKKDGETELIPCEDYFSYQDASHRAAKLADLSLTQIDIFTGSCVYDTMLWFMKRGGVIDGFLDYRLQVKSQKEAEAFMEGYCLFLSECLLSHGQQDGTKKVDAKGLASENMDGILASEKAMLGHDAVDDGYLHFQERDGQKICVAYVKLKAGEILTISELRRHMKNALSDPIIPKYLLEVASLERNADGKVTSKNLKSLLEQDSLQKAPLSPVEKGLSEIWQRLLKTEKLGPVDRFFDLGGHSLLAVEMMQEVQEAFNVKLDLQLIFVSTLSQLAHQIEILSGQNGKTASQPDPLSYREHI